MSSSKTVKITSGKILNYTISAPGYKTMEGSRLITADTTIQKNLIPSVDPNGVYSLGDRFANCSSFVGYSNSTHPETGVDILYAVFVLDAKYRTRNIKWSREEANTGLQQYSGYSYNTLFRSNENCMLSATYNNDYIMNTYYPSASTVDKYPSFKKCNDIKLPEFNLTAKIPTPYEVYLIWYYRLALDNADPTLLDYSDNALNNWTMVWTCYEVSSVEAWIFNSSGNFNSSRWEGANKTDGTNHFLVPVFEVPVN